MQADLKPCPYRLVDNEGRILCNQIKSGERDVSPSICRACPIAQIDCTHLRATLDHPSRTPFTVRWGNGKTEIWDNPTPPLALARAACSAKTIPILSPHDCSGCPLRQPFVAEDAIPVMRKHPPVPRPTPKRKGDGEVLVQQLERVAYQPCAKASQNPQRNLDRTPHFQGDALPARTSLVAQKIIQLQEWLTRQKNVKKEEEDAGVMPIAFGARSVQAAGEERRVGWTD